MSEVRLKEGQELWDSGLSTERPEMCIKKEEEDFDFPHITVTLEQLDEHCVLHQRPAARSQEETNGDDCGADCKEEQLQGCRSVCNRGFGCIVEQLLHKPFTSETLQQKTGIVERGRPTPDMPQLLKVRVPSAGSENPGYTRHFHSTAYEKPWLTGCPNLNKLFCWSCLLFSSEKSVWNNNGFDDLRNLSRNMQTHERSQNHIRSALAQKVFESTRKVVPVNHQFAIELHNKKVRTNREVLKRLINVVTVLGGHCERSSFTDLVNLVKEYDVTLATHLDTCPVFSALSSDFQKDLVDAVSLVILDEIKREVSQALYVSVMLEGTTDVSDAARVSTVLRIVSEDGLVTERFVGFADVSEEHTAVELSERVFEFLHKFNCGGKLVAQSYDGAVVKSEELKRLQDRVKKRYPCATFVHSCSHVLNLVLSQACSRNKHCNIFFSTLSGFASFFSASAKRRRALEEIVQKRYFRAAPTQWDHTNVVSVVKAHYSCLLELFNHIIHQPYYWDSDSVLAAGGFLRNLEDNTFRFLLEVFSDIFANTDVLSSALQSKRVDISYWDTEVKRVAKLQERKHTVYAFLATATESGESSAKKPRLFSDDLKKLYVEIIDTVVLQLKQRFESLKNLTFLELLDVSKFEIHRTVFPEKALRSLKETYGRLFNMTMLRTELVVLYSSTELAKNNITELTSYMNDSGIRELMAEVYKLCCLYLTIPWTAASENRSWTAARETRPTSPLNSQSALGQVDGERQSALRLMVAERELLRRLKSEAAFYERVTEYFVKEKKNWSMEFIYK